VHIMCCGIPYYLQGVHKNCSEIEVILNGYSYIREFSNFSSSWVRCLVQKITGQFCLLVIVIENVLATLNSS
jgi:hypothetical protein